MSKYANVLFSKELQRKFDDKNIDAKAVSLHPGVVYTEIWSKSIVNKYLALLILPISKLLS